MKYFGFIREHDDYPISKSIHDLIIDETSIDPHRADVLVYLQNGTMTIPLMGFVENAKDPLFGSDDYDDESFVAYNMIYTDGIWLWPQYIIEYIKKYSNIKLDSEFVDYIIKNKDTKVNISEEDCSKIEKDFYNKFWNNN
ncbi:MULTISPECIES: hypothetical protein [Chryseobacterium]|uniref:hypothetical protein n=1 Tax=Chryseobacterium TaxID=59732 RepID=UPI0024E241FA|nr:hypothetical protein [Chryseobacterium sp.]